MEGYDPDLIDKYNRKRRLVNQEHLRRKLTESKTYYVNYRVIEDDLVVHMQLRIVNVGNDNHISQVVWGGRNAQPQRK